jgi:hypothetical protein
MAYEMVEETQVKAPEIEAASTEATEQQAEAEVAAEVTDTSPKPGTPEYTQAVQKRINQITREKHEAIRKADTLTAENAALKRRLEAGTRPIPPDPATFTNPDTGQIDPGKYQKATVEHEDKLHTWRQAQQPASQLVAPGTTTASPTFSDFNERAKALREKHTDFDEVVDRPYFTPELATVLYESEQGPEIAYHLGKNEAEAKRIGNLPPAQMQREFGKLEARFSAEAGKRSVSGAPAPITPVTGTATVTKDPEKMTTQEFMEWDKQLKVEKLKKQQMV